jgi:NSS family neurotransmitter:Na+ symporter
MTLPIVFGSVTGGAILGSFFFLLLSFAALTSALCMLEAPASYLVDQWRWQRRWATLAVGGLVWTLGLLCVFSFSLLSEVRPLGGIAYFASMTFFDLFDFVVTRVLSPVIGACIALFVGWVVTRKISADELDVDGGQLSYRLWLFSVRYLVPMVLLVLCYTLLIS